MGIMRLPMPGHAFSNCFVQLVITGAEPCVPFVMRRHLAKAAKRKAARLTSAAAEAGGDGNPGCVDAERVVAIEAEYQRAKERLTLRHRNSSRWARRALKRGQLQMDEGGVGLACR